MGGSGGRGYFSSDPRRIERELQASQQATDVQEYQATCNQALQSLLAEFNNRDTDAIARRLDQIRAILSDDLEGTVDLRFGGSVAKHTFVDGISDVDSLVLINKSELAALTPVEVKRYFADQLRAGLRDVTVTEGDLAVTVQFEDLQIQLLPALKTEGGYKIASPQGGWADIRPQEFSHALTRLNETNGSKLVPVIKLAKAVVGTLPERQRLKGYHVEALALEIFRGYSGGQSYKDMLHYFLAEASPRANMPLRDTTGQSAHVDDYLGGANSLERRLVADALDRLARRMRNADAAQSVDQITALFE
jgi:hypothetical protein